MDAREVPKQAVPTPEELQETTAELGLDAAQLKDIFRYAFTRFDSDGDGSITFEEFRVACCLTSLDAPQPTLEKLFRAFSKGKDFLLPMDVQDALEDEIGGMVSTWYDESGLKKGEYILSNIMEAFEAAMQEQLPPEERMRRLFQVLQSQGEHLIEAVEFVIASALLVIKLDCLPNCQEVDWTDLVPPLTLLFKSTREVFTLLEDRRTISLNEDEAALFAKAFKPSGFSVVGFQQLVEQTNARWITLPARTRIPMKCFKDVLAVIGRGKLRIQEASAAPGLSETHVELGAGSFIGSSAFLDSFTNKPRQGTWCTETKFAVMMDDVKLLRWDVLELHKYLAMHKEEQRKLQYAFSWSVTRTMCKAREQSAKISRELPLLFRDMLLRMRLHFKVDRASLWVHEPAKKTLWTLFVTEDGTSSHFSIPEAVGLAGHAFAHGAEDNIPDCYADERFNREVDKKTGYYTKSMLILPILDQQGKKTIGVLQLINRLSSTPDTQGGRGAGIIPFSDDDVQEVKDSLWQTSLMVAQLRKRYGTSTPIYDAEQW